MKKILILLVMISSQIAAQPFQVPWADDRSDGQNLTIKLVTFGVGDDIPSWWGHTALIVEDQEFRRSRIYNFGLFSFEDGMLFKFIMGRLIFSAGDFSVPGYLSYYKSENREIRIVTLNMPDDTKRKLAKKLADAILPVNKYYLYHHYYDNCSTRLRDLLNECTGGALKKESAKPAKMSLRDHTKRYTGHSPFMELLLMYLMNDSIDKPCAQWDEMFLPDELEAHILRLTYPDSTGQDSKLAKEQFTFFKAERAPIPEDAPDHYALMIISGALLALLSFSTAWYYVYHTTGIKGRVFFGLYHSILGFIIGLPGLGLGLMASFTDHSVTYYNENLLLSNPLTFLIFLAGAAILMNKKRSLDWFKALVYLHLILAVIALVIKIFPVFDQDNYMVFAFILPVWAGLGVTAWFISGKTNPANQKTGSGQSSIRI
ncbi:MAG: DUF4105 domain-containing protein [Calditrichaceae bacterium]|nr:DUF4105 domain-containing protein [Calditrichaceae bacterium]MBN2707449.1 DUF4105 domain-containing protein [Calditrichaceae bacterium]RQV94016.1 MAG: DUF4105 domain-containing protein [Calditrichota bacterium]